VIEREARSEDCMVVDAPAAMMDSKADGKPAGKAAKSARRIFEGTQDADKMLIRWVKVSTTLVATGVGVDRALAYLSGTAPLLDPAHVLRLTGQCLALLGIVALWIACYQHWQTVQRIRNDDPLPNFRFSLTLTVGACVSVLAVVVLISVVVAR
jgi:uncharacterized membrane protein YidH (DUF202 family)